jgi:PAS domain S-box-containing protein
MSLKNKADASPSGLRRRIGALGQDGERRREAAWWKHPIFAANPQPLFVHDASTLAILAANAAALRLYGYSRTAFLKLTVPALHPKTSVSKRQTFKLSNGVWLQRKRNGRVFSVRIMTFAFRHAGRRVRLVQATVTTNPTQVGPAPRGKPARAQSILTAMADSGFVRVANRKRTSISAMIEPEQLKHLARIEAVLDHLTEGLIIADPAGAILHWNPAALKIHGFANKAKQQGDFANVGGLFELATLDGRILPPGDWPLARILRGEILQECELQVRRKDRRNWRRFLSYGGALARGQDGQPLLAVLTITDITRRKQADDALRQSAERLRQGVRVARLGLFEHNHLTEAVYYSPVTREIWGWDARTPISLEQIIQSVAPEDRARLFAAIQRAHDPASDGLFATEHRIVRPDGTLRWVSTRSQTTFEGQGSKRHPVRTIGALIDITERKEAEAAMRNVLRNARTIIMHARVTAPPGWDQHPPEWSAPNFHWSAHFDDEEACQEVLPLKLEPGEDYSYGWGRAKHPDDQAFMSLVAARAFISGATRWSQEFRAIDRHGHLHWFAQAASLEPLAAGCWRVTTINTDITKRKQAEEALRYHYNLIQSITNNTAASIFVTDKAGRITFMNTEAWKTFGYSDRELTGHVLHDRLHHNHADGSKFPLDACPLARTLSSGASVRDHEDVFYHKDGTPICVSCSNGRLEVDGQWVGTVIVLHDITARKEAEENLQRARDELELRVAERTAELARINQELKQENADRVQAEQAIRRQSELLDMASDAVIIRDFDGTIRYWNRGAERLYGFSFAEAKGKPSQQLLATVFPRGIETSKSTLLKEGVWSGEVTQTTKTGRRVVVESHHQLVKQPDGSMLVLVTNHDITERVSLHDEIVAAGERERERIGQNLHDGLCQLLTAARLKADSLVTRLADQASAHVKTVKTLATLMAQAVDEARDLARGLEPVEHLPEGLMSALQQLAANTSRLFSVNCLSEIPQPVFVADHRVATELFRIAQEAVNNAIKHSRAGTIRIRLAPETGAGVLTVICDGSPFPRHPRASGMGLKTMHFRAGRIGATLEIKRGARRGTILRCVLPVSEDSSPRNPPTGSGATI